MLDFLIATAAAQSAALPKDPFSYPAVAYLWVIVWSAAGGIVSFRQKMLRGDARAFNMVEFIGEVTTSSFVGVISFWLCEYSEVPKLLEAVIIAVSGHMGTRAIFIFERYLMKKFGVEEPKS
jgi:CHASE2 domain-containing sensor protein